MEKQETYRSGVGVVVVSQENDSLLVRRGCHLIGIMYDLPILGTIPLPLSPCPLKSMTYNWPKQPIGVLHRCVRVIPECASLVDDGELVREICTGRNGALSNTCNSVHYGAVLLVDAVPVDRCASVSHLVVDMDLSNLSVS